MAAVDNRFNRNPFQHTVELSGPGGLIGVFLKESGFGPVVLLKLSDEDDLAEILLGEVLTIEVKVEIALQGGFQVASGGEGGGFQHLGDAVVEVLDHAVGLRVFGPDQEVLDAVHGAGLIEGDRSAHTRRWYKSAR